MGTAGLYFNFFSPPEKIQKSHLRFRRQNLLAPVVSFTSTPAAKDTQRDPPFPVIHTHPSILKGLQGIRRLEES